MSNERVLVVDDDPAILSLCNRILKSDGYAVTDAKRGEDALALIEANSFDVLLTDIRLPGLSGLEVAQRLRRQGGDLTIVTMTGYSNMEMAIQALSLGVDEFIVKPFTPDVLKLTVSRALEKSRLRRENHRLRALMPLFEMTRELTTAHTAQELYSYLTQSLASLVGAGEVAVIELSEGGEQATVVEAVGKRMAPLVQRRFSTAVWTDRNALLQGGIKVWRHAEHPNLLPLLTENSPQETVICAPFDGKDNEIGLVLILKSAGEAALSPGDLEALGVIMSQASVVLANVKLLGDIETAYQNLRELDRLKTEFIHIAGHEIRTPLAVLTGYAYLLRESVQDQAHEYVQAVIENAERLNSLAEELTNLKDLEARRVSLHLQRLQVQQVVSPVIQAYCPLANEARKNLSATISPDAGELMADRAMLGLMLGHLVSNALKFSPKESSVIVGAHGALDHVVFYVKDRGRGMPPEELGRIFEPFYQVDNSLTRKHDGLGLALTREIVRSHGGKIWVESQAGEGSTFYVSLPRSGPNGWH